MDALFPAFMKQLMIYTPTSAVAGGTVNPAAGAAGVAGVQEMDMSTDQLDGEHEQQHVEGNADDAVHRSTEHPGVSHQQSDSSAYLPQGGVVSTELLMAECNRSSVLGDLFEGMAGSRSAKGGDSRTGRSRARSAQDASSSSSASSTPGKLGKRRAR
jgi:hypothetical protein